MYSCSWLQSVLGLELFHELVRNRKKCKVHISSAQCASYALTLEGFIHLTHIGYTLRALCTLYGVHWGRGVTNSKIGLGLVVIGSHFDVGVHRSIQSIKSSISLLDVGRYNN